MSSVNFPLYWIAQNTRRWLRPLVVAGIVLLSLALSLAFSAPELQMLLLLISGMAAVLLFMRWPPLGLVALIGTLAISFEGPSGSNATWALVGLLLGLWLLDIIIRQRRISALPARPVWPLLSLVVVAGLALGAGQLPWYTFAQPAPFGAQLAGLSIFILSAGAFLLVAYRVHDERWLQAMTWLLLALGAAYIASLLVPGMSAVADFLPYETTHGSLFWTWLVALAFSQAAFNQRLHPVARTALAALTLATLYVAFFINRDWSSGWIPALASIAVALVVANSRFGLPIVAAGAVGAIAYSQEVASLVMGGDNAYSTMTRLEAWKIILEIVKVNPILGLGPANYSAYTPLFPILGWSVQFNSHSQYVDLIAQTGLLGLACYLWFFAAVGWLGWRLRERVPAGFARAYVCGALGGLAGMLIAGGLGDWVLPYFYNVTLGGFRASVLGWLFLGGLIVLERTRPLAPQK